MWDLWQKGETLGSIARLFDRHHSSIERIIAETGGIRPAPRRRASRCLSLAEREEISRGIATGQSLRAIADSLTRSPSTISPEIKRNGSRQCYRANEADKNAWDRAHRPKICNLVENPPAGIYCGKQASVGVVFRADCWLAEADLSE
jgi:hypothetical protein